MNPILATLTALLPNMTAHAALLDRTASFPAEDFAALREAGLLHAPVPPAYGGAGLGTEASKAQDAMTMFRLIGSANLAVGRLFEAHVNALKLVFRFAEDPVCEAVAAQARRGELFALWVTDPPDGGLRIDGDAVTGAKQFCSGAGHVGQAVVTATDAAGRTRLAHVELGREAKAAPLAGGLAGMRAATTGQVTFDHAPATLFGEPGDYLREPDFSCGAWRTAAVTLGGLDALVDQLCRQLVARGRAGDPHQQARVGQALIAAETARLWMTEAATRAECDGDVGYVGLARLATERACLDVMELVQRSLGVAALRRGDPVERLCRDLATYLRQPAADMVLTEAAAAILREVGR